jgi:hypothetical protein
MILGTVSLYPQVVMYDRSPNCIIIGLCFVLASIYR